MAATRSRWSPPWAERKRAYLAHLRAAPDEVLLVSGCDKLCNAGDIVADLRALGPAVFDRFTAGRDGTLWYYGELARLFAARRAPMAAALGEAVAAMQAGAGLASSNVAT